MKHTYYDKLDGANFSAHGRERLSMKQTLSPFDILLESEKPDVYGKGRLIEEFQDDIADYLGKEAALFFPSGTMAQQIAMRIYCDECGINRVAYHPTCHMEIHEERGLHELHNIEPVLIGDKNRLFNLEDLKTLSDVSTVLFELPQRELGAIAPTWKELTDMVDYCQDEGLYLHLDGARLFEILPHYDVSAKQVADFFDSVYISFYKGLGGIAGAMLAGSKDFIEKAKVWKQRYGGNLYHLYPYVVTAKYVFESERDKMAIYRDNAVEYAALLNKIEGVKTVPEVPICNTFHVHFKYNADTVLDALEKALDETGLALFRGMIKEVSKGRSKTEIYMSNSYIMVPKTILNMALEYFEYILEKHREK